ncbi:MAG TPA: serine/threonine-protein kinase [Solirubrobacterales bacterium]|nr:serine/threonine-protein kinase [Solirubrobacterales bacterium]
MGDYASWGLEESEEIVPGRFALKPIGGGNRYEVYLVWDEHLYSLGVAKVLRPDQAEDERALRDLEKEAEALGTLAHPVLIRHFDAVLEGPRPHILIEHLEGPSLRRLIKRGGSLPLEQALPLAIHVAGALQYMANDGYVHLDCKPDNIVMGVPPRLIDLSIARTIERAARSKGPLGTAAYQAPEQCGDERASDPIGPPADAWGLGATLFHAVAGRRPFSSGDRRASGAERYRQLIDEPRPLPDHLPSALRDLLIELLSKDPASRPTCAEAIERLEPIVAELPSRMTFTPRGVLGG